MKRRGSESGQAVIAATIILSLVLLALLTMLTQVQLSNKLVSRQLTYQGQAANVAQAGLVDALSWFRRQGKVVTTFNPTINASANPPINDTDDTTIGIVRTYQVSVPSRLMSRYEVRYGVAAAGTGVLDITPTKGKSATGGAAGTVWQLESVGTVWVQNDTSKNYNVSPNVILSQQTFRTEVQRMAVTLPDGGEAVYSGNCDKVTIGAKSKIMGGPAIGISCHAGGGSGVVNNGIVTGTTQKKTNSTAAYDVPTVFGVTTQELQGLADVNVTQITDLPATLPSMSLIVVNADATFTNARPLTGSGILVVFGNLTLSSGSDSDWNGIIYATGNISIAEPSLVSGAIISASTTSTVTVNSGSDIAEVDYDPSMIGQINAQMGQYRFSRSRYWVGK
ncbi:MAG TPA: hypothetical protein VN380_18650 [Thermoanaerobaculia bacterium]|nr:hypothetical protein [Thermoanaerobaculia bacterium]